MLDESPVLAGALMTRDVAVIGPEASLLDAVKLMVARQISGLPVVDQHGAIIGMLSEGDLVRWHEGYTDRETRWLEMLADGFALAPDFLRELSAQRQKVSAVMRKDVITITEDVPVREVARIMYANSIKRVPVVRDGKLVGIIARSDLVRALAERLGERIKEEPDPPASIDEALRRARVDGTGRRR